MKTTSINKTLEKLILESNEKMEFITEYPTFIL